jgi:hypothetical protein
MAVNTNADTSDALPGDGVCADAAGACSLRAAVEESNAVPGNTIVIVPDNIYVLNSPLIIDDDIALSGYGKDVSIIDGNNSSQLIHVRTTELLVCDAGNDSIASYRLNGARNPDFVAAGAAGLNGPTAIDFRYNNSTYEQNIYITADSGVHQFAGDGADNGLFFDPVGYGLVNVSASDGIFVASSTVGYDFYMADYFPNNRILRINAETGHVNTFVADGVGGLQQPNNLAFYDEDFFVTSATTGQVLRYDGVTGTFEDAFVEAGLNTPRGLVFHNDALYVADAGSDSVRKYDDVTGAFIGEFVAPGAGGLDAPTDLTFGPDGDLYVISSGTQSILRYDGDTGAARGVFVAGGTAHLEQPTCLEWRVGSGSGPTVSIGELSLRNGKTEEIGGRTAGISIDTGAKVTITDTNIYDNASRVLGGGIRNEGELIILNVEVYGNSLIDGGGGQMSQGGGIFNTGRIRVIRSTIADNHAVRGGGISNTNRGRIDIMSSTISGNSANGPGGGIRNVAEGVIYISASTITNNRANVPSEFPLNEPDPYGGGIFNDAPAKIFMSNTIVAGNSDNRDRYQDGFSPDCYSPASGRFISNRDNLIGILTDNCVLQDATTGDTSFELFGTPEAPLDPKLETLWHYGGPTRTHKLRSDSPAIDADTHQIGKAFYDCHAIDQRSSPRPQGRACDIGAFELVRGVDPGQRGPGGLISDKPPVIPVEVGVIVAP